jgi:uncharacterized protein DUF5658
MTYADSRAIERSPVVHRALWHFTYLQILDFLTTIAFLVNGGREGNPLVRLALGLAGNPIAALLAVKVLAVFIGIYCWRMRRERLLSHINVVFAAVVAWNVIALILGSIALRHT